MKPLWTALAVTVALATTGLAVVFTQSKPQAVPAVRKNQSGLGRAPQPIEADQHPIGGANRDATRKQSK